MPKYNRGIKREHYAAAQQRFADGRWTCDPETGRIWSARTRSWMRPTVRRNGYRYLSIHLHGRNRALTLSRVIWEYVNGPIPDGLEVNHKNGNKLDDRIGNYELVTSSGNKAHAHEMGLARATRGSESTSAKVTESQVVEIRNLCRQRVPQHEIARRYGITQPTVSYINTGRRWSHVSDRGASHRGPDKLTADQVREIRSQLAAGSNQYRLAEQYGVSQPCISDIKRGRRWAHLI